jgi:hypothetical protein
MENPLSKVCEIIRNALLSVVESPKYMRVEGPERLHAVLQHAVKDIVDMLADANEQPFTTIEREVYNTLCDILIYDHDNVDVLLKNCRTLLKHLTVYYERSEDRDEQTPDHFGRVWMHCEEGLSYSKASMSRFMMFVLKHQIEIGSIYAFNPKYERSAVLASIKLKPEQFDAFEKETGGKLRLPARLAVN